MRSGWSSLTPLVHIIACVCWHVIWTHSPIGRCNPAVFRLIQWVQAFRAYPLCRVMHDLISSTVTQTVLLEISPFYLALMPVAQFERNPCWPWRKPRLSFKGQLFAFPSLASFFGSCATPVGLKAHVFIKQVRIGIKENPGYKSNWCWDVKFTANKY